MLLPLLALLVQTPQTPPQAPAAAKPVRVWLASGDVLQRGDPVRVYVQAAADGYLVVLHRRTDGRIEVLFPAHPADDPYVTPGTYEIREAGDRPSFVVAEPDGTGLILAALAPRSYRFQEFERAAVWDPAALVPSWSGADGEGALSDIVQRMLGDGYFSWDIVTYTVAPRAPQFALTGPDSEPQPQYSTYPPCVDCSFVGFQEIIYEPFSGCDPFFDDCFAATRFRRHERFSSSPSRTPPMNVMALSLGPAAPRAVAGVGQPITRLTSKSRGAGSPPVTPRSRVPAIPLGPGYSVAHSRPARPAPASFQEVRLTLSPTTPAEEARPVTEVRRDAHLVAVPREAATAAQHLVASAMDRSRVSPVSAPLPSAAQARARGAAAVGAGGGTSGQTHGMALPAAVWRAAGSRGGTVSGAGAGAGGAVRRR
jgi:uncharacterized protein DUF4384